MSLRDARMDRPVGQFSNEGLSGRDISTSPNNLVAVG